MTREHLDQLVRQYLSQTFEQIEVRLAAEWSEVARDVHSDDLCEEAERISAGLARIDYGLGLGEAQRLLPGAPEETLRMLARRLMEAKLDAVKAELAVLSGEPLRKPLVGSQEFVTQSASDRAVPAPLQSLRLSEVAARYEEEQVARGRWTDRSAMQYAGIHAVLVDLLGDPLVGQVTKAHTRELGLALLKYPANAKKFFPGLGPKEALAAAEAATGREFARLAPASVNMYQQAARSLFKWAVDNDVITSNPAAVIKDVDTGLAEDDRYPLDDDDIRAYFRRLGEEAEPFMLWIPRILAYTGCRLGEVASLEKRDVREKDGILVFDINADHPSKRLKNKYSRRSIPVHPRLIELGLLTYLEDCPEGFLWPEEYRTNKRGRSSVDKLQRRLARCLRKAGVTDPKKTGAHSLRHTVAYRLQAASVEEYLICSVLGHKRKLLATSRYGGKAQMPVLLEVLKKISLPV